MGKQVISVRQFTIIVMLFSIGTAILIIPASISQEIKQDAWIAALLGVILSLLIVKLFIGVGNINSKMTFVEINEGVLGKYVGKITSIAFILFSFIGASELLYYLENFMNSIMPETPAAAFGILFMLVIIYSMYLGIETFARATELLVPLFVLIFVFFVICISPQIDIQNIQPIFETRTKPLIFSILLFLSVFSFPQVVLLMIFPSAINVHKSASKGFYIGTIAGGVVLFIMIVLAIAVLGATNVSQNAYPSYTLAMRISIGNILERIEIIMAFMWIITIFIKTFMYFYASILGLSQVLKMKDYRSLIFPMGMILFTLSQIGHPNIVDSHIFDKEAWLPFSLIFAIILPLLLLVIAKLRGIKS
ncbi:endospore germination permease [Viridibacillus sp. YIM B01967]|uniref:Endospore germination permease n=1 Tax=Viridibacillus soli TaxID=2798301 RepID=A0ABS1H4B9_9BACL|nr:endospore germination permease [Viridibacillus soli]MBK3494259.1 endospore germination permease [Viridibacillus soli]